MFIVFTHKICESVSASMSLDLMCEHFMEVTFLFLKFVKSRCKNFKVFDNWECGTFTYELHGCALRLCPSFSASGHLFWNWRIRDLMLWSSGTHFLVVIFHSQGCNRQSEHQENYKTIVSIFGGFMGIFVWLRLSLFIRTEFLPC